MPVYFLRAGEDGAIKIGYGNDPRSRLSGLQTGSPVELRLMATMPGGAAEEAALHARFAAERLRGEWFRASPELLGFIAAQELAEPPRRTRHEGSPLAAYLRRSGIDVCDFAARIGVHFTTLYRYLRNERRPSARVMRAIVRETDGAVMPNDFFGIEAA